MTNTKQMPCQNFNIRKDVFNKAISSRSKAKAHRLLLGYHGNIQVDGYNVYDDFEKIEGITLYGCWAHARRKFVEALEED